MIEQNDSLSLTTATRPLRAPGLRGHRLASIFPSKAPDLGSNRRLAATALMTTLAMCVLLSLHLNHLSKSLGDADDAMRLVLVRDLLAGRGWYDQWVGRLQPPVGVYLHWSRLLDGALAGAIWLLERILSPARAEFAVRFAWPLLWIFPAVACAMVIARNLGGRTAVFACALLCTSNPLLYAQFVPGRVDHHNVQIVMALIAVACATAPTRRVDLAIVAGIASGFGLAIGIEALVFHALVGASYALRLAADREEGSAARAYGLSLAAATLVFFGLQTPPWRWALPFCDAIGLNLVAAVAVAGLGLAVVATWAASQSTVVRTTALLALGVVTAGLYLAFDPHCLEGPFGDVDPRLRSIWFNGVGELASWPQLWGLDRVVAFQSIIATVSGLAAAIVLIASRWRRPSAPTLLALALLAIAGLASAFAVRMENYAFWFGIPVLAAAVAQIAMTKWENLLVPTAVASLVVSPCLAGAALDSLSRPLLSPSPTVDMHSGVCFDAAGYRPLAALPPGVVLAQVNLGSFILAHTRDSALSAPYLVTWGILAAHQAMASPAAVAESRVRALNVTYIVECPAQPLWDNANGLEADLRRGRTPAWLQALSTPDQTLQIYRVRR